MGSAILIGIGVATLLSLLFGGSPPELPPDVRAALLTKLNSWAQMGIPYIWGGRDPDKGLDCSGAITACVVECGYAPKSFLNNTADSLYRMCKSVSESDAKAGDLAFYGSRFHVTHVMMCVGDGRLIGASGGGRDTTSEAVAKAQNAKVKIVPAGKRSKDFVGYGRLPFKEDKAVS